MNASGQGPSPDVLETWFKSASAFTRDITQCPPSWAEEHALETFVSLAHAGANASLTQFFSPSMEGTWFCETEKREPGVVGGVAFGGAFDAPPNVLEKVTAGKSVNLGHALYLPIFSKGDVGGCIVFIRDPNDPKFLEKEVARAETIANIGALATELVSAREAQNLATVLSERDRISRDLHDLGIQDLFAVGMGLQALKSDVQAGVRRREIVRRLEGAMAGLEDAITQIRSVVHDLQTPEGPSSFAEALHFEASKARSHLGFAPTLTLEVDGRPVTDATGSDPEVERSVDQRIHPDLTADIVAVLREALMNIAKHAGARSAKVGVSIHGSGPSGEVEMVIVDDGAGVDPSVSRSSGLSNMAGRAHDHGGSFAVSSGPRGRGTSLVWRAPLE